MLGQDTTAAAVDVTFLRMDQPPARPAPALPPGADVVRLAQCSIAFYRYLYATVGHDYVWWLRRTLSDAELRSILEDARVSIHVLYQGGEPAGFYELDRRNFPAINLAYFGLMPQAIGRGLGGAFLRHAVDTVWGEGARAMTVNTCTADHPRALPNYVAAGFVPQRVIREIWRIPNALGLPIPERLKLR